MSVLPLWLDKVKEVPIADFFLHTYQNLSTHFYKYHCTVMKLTPEEGYWFIVKQHLFVLWLEYILLGHIEAIMSTKWHLGNLSIVLSAHYF